MSTQFLFDGPEDARITILFAHGAGAPMDSPWMNAVAKAFATAGLRVVRFEFAYMAARRMGDGRKPPPKAERLLSEYVTTVDDLGPISGPLIIGGKSMGGRVASMVADPLFEAGGIGGLLCLGYPFHPPAKPDQLRTAHLTDLRCPTLICQGTRDQFGTRDDVSNYTFSNAVELLWLEDGDHNLKPRKSVSGYTAADHLQTMAETVIEWTKRIRG